jgi:Swt1-like HEPN
VWGQQELRLHLKEKLEIGDRQLRRLIAQRARELPSTNVEALWSLAHEHGLRLQNYLTSEQIARVRGLRSGASAPQPSSRPAPARQPASKKSPRRTVSLTIGEVSFGEIPGLKASHAEEAKAMAERVYPLLYVFENSVRDLIELVLKARYGSGWWATAVPARVREAAENLKEQEKRDTYHGKRGRRDIDYLLLLHLWRIIDHKWPDFTPFFPPGKHWVQSLIENDMNVSRRPIAHMNPLREDDIKNVEQAFRKWRENLEKVEGKLPQL